MRPRPYDMCTPMRLPTMETTFSILHCHSGLETDNNIQTLGHFGPLSSVIKSGAEENLATIKVFARVAKNPKKQLTASKRHIYVLYCLPMIVCIYLQLN